MCRLPCQTMAEIGRRFTGEFFVPGESGHRIEADHLERYRHASQFVAGRRVLDIACGAGYGSRLLREAGATEVIGVDVSEDALTVASEYASEGVRFENGDITTWTDAAGFDVIVCFETIEHVPDPFGAIKQLRSMLRSNGTLMMSSPNRPVTSSRARTMYDKPTNEFHIHEFTPPELAGLLSSAGFNVEREVLGQRIQLRVPVQAQRFVTRLLRPADRGSPRLRPLRPWESARYFVLTVH